MKIIRWFLSVALLLLGAPFFLLGLYVALNAESKPMHSLRGDEFARIESAQQFVEKHIHVHGQLPTEEEFKVWEKNAPESFRLDGVGFSYIPHKGSRAKEYKFSFWQGDARVTWNSANTGINKYAAEISPGDYFFTGSKLSDVLIFLAVGLTSMLCAIFAAPKSKATYAH